jgi:hypothetical protein
MFDLLAPFELAFWGGLCAPPTAPPGSRQATPDGGPDGSDFPPGDRAPPRRDGRSRRAAGKGKTRPAAQLP